MATAAAWDPPRFLLFAGLGFEVVEEGQEVVDLGDDAFLLR
jgi:hypothetical protein